MRRWIRAASRSPSDGFTLIEIILAMFLTVIVMAALLSVLVSSLQTVAQARQRQTATALATKSLEQLRALPYDAVTIANSVAYPLTTGLPYVDIPTMNFAPTGVLAVASEPLIVNRYSGKSAPQTVDGVTYTVQTYVTKPAATPAGQQTFNLTAIVSWTSPVYLSPRTAAERTIAYSPLGCLSTAQHPFAAPCQAYFTAQAGRSPGGFTLTGIDATQPIPGFDGSLIGLNLPVLSANLGIEQTASGSASVATSETRTVKTGTVATKGGLPAGASVDSDPSSPPNQQVQSTTASQTSSALALAAAFGQLVARPTSGDSGRASAAIAATSLYCEDGTKSGAGLVTGAAGALLPCSSASVLQAGVAGSLVYADNGPSVASLLTLTPSATSAFPSRAVAATLAVPQAGVACFAGTTLTGTGCARAASYRALADLVVGSPSAAITSTGAPLGLWTLTGLEESAGAESGSGAMTTPAYTRAGTLMVWTGIGNTGYESVPLNPLPADGTPYTVTSPLVTREYAGNLTVTLEGSVTVTQPRLTTSGAADCKATACVARVDGGGIRAQTVFTVYQTGVQKTQFLMLSQLGSLSAQSTFKAAPGA